MKILWPLLGGLLLFISCSSDDTLLNEIVSEHIDIPVDPSILREYHEYNFDGSIKLKCKFDSEGRLKQILESGHSTTFIYDTNNRITTISEGGLDANSTGSHHIVYDGQDRVLSLGDRTFDYDPLGDFYTEDILYNYDYDEFGDIIWVVNRHERFVMLSNGNPIPQFCEYFEEISTNTTTGQVTINGYCSENSTHTLYVNSNVTAAGITDDVSAYTFDTKVNPLFYEHSNIAYIAGFLLEQYGHKYASLLYKTISKNKTTSVHWDPSGGPEVTAYVYDLNALSLPTYETAQWYYNGTYEGEYLKGRYYYQGDLIP